jgi:hypothetical protein
MAFVLDVAPSVRVQRTTGAIIGFMGGFSYTRNLASPIKPSRSAYGLFSELLTML